MVYSLQKYYSKNQQDTTKIICANKKLTYKPTDTNHLKHSKYKRKIIWFNPPFSINHSTLNIVKTARNYLKNTGQQNSTISHQNLPGE